jgi:hypothetical protein
MTPKEWNLIHNLAKKHETEFSTDHDEGPDFWGGSGASRPIKAKLETHLRQHGHRQRLLKEAPRLFDDETRPTPRKILSGLVSEYNRKKELSQHSDSR